MQLFLSLIPDQLLLERGEGGSCQHFFPSTDGVIVTEEIEEDFGVRVGGFIVQVNEVARLSVSRIFLEDVGEFLVCTACKEQATCDMKETCYRDISKARNKVNLQLDFELRIRQSFEDLSIFYF